MIEFRSGLRPQGSPPHQTPHRFDAVLVAPAREVQQLHTSKLPRAVVLASAFRISSQIHSPALVFPHAACGVGWLLLREAVLPIRFWPTGRAFRIPGGLRESKSGAQKHGDRNPARAGSPECSVPCAHRLPHQPIPQESGATPCANSKLGSDGKVQTIQVWLSKTSSNSRAADGCRSWPGPPWIFLANKNGTRCVRETNTEGSQNNSTRVAVLKRKVASICVCPSPQKRRTLPEGMNCRR